jgi:DNA-binding transcriptional MerR regulator
MDAGMKKPAPSAPHRIGEVAARFGVSTRTLRYYEEIGLIDPTGKSPGGNRRYSDEDVARIERVLELRNVMGFELERIASIVRAENRLEVLRDEYARGVSHARHAEIIREATEINDELRTHVAEKMTVLRAFGDDLDARAERLRQLSADLAPAPGA